MRVRPFFVPVVLILALLGTIFVAQSAGIWSISGRTEVKEQLLAPADIKGWMTLQQVIDGMGVSQAELYRVIGLSEDMPTSTALKDVEGIVPGFEIAALRDALTAKLAAPSPDDGGSGSQLQSK